MDPLLLFIIVMVIVLIVTVFGVVMIIVFAGKSKSSGKTVIDMKRWLSQKRVIVYTPHSELFTGDWKNATEDRDKVLVREAGWLKRPEHELDMHDYIEMQDAETKHTYIFNGVSAFNIELAKRNQKLQLQNEKLKSELSEAKADKINATRHIDKQVDKIVGTAGQIMKTIPYIKTGGSSSHK